MKSCRFGTEGFFFFHLDYNSEISKKEQYLELHVVVAFNSGGHSFISRMEGNTNLTCWFKLFK